MLKKIIAIILCLIILTVTTAGTLAYFSDQEQSEGNIMAAATLNLTVNDTDGAVTTFSVSNANPGASGNSYVTLDNTGSITGVLDIAFSAVQNVGGSGDTQYEDGIGNLGGAAELAVFLDTDQDGTWDADDIGLKSDGTLYDYATYNELQYDIIDNFSGMESDNVQTLESHGATDFRVYWSVPAATSNNIQGDNVTFDMNFDLRQYVASGSATAITAIGAISGTATVGQTLTVGTVTPSGATVTYQWQRCSTSGGTYASISGATSSTYTLTASDYGYYIQVTATGSGSYSGTVTSAYTGPAAACTITAISAITGTTSVGYTLTAGTVTPSGATVTYQWQASDTSGSNYSDISGATSSTYYISDLTYSYCYLRVVVTGTGAYTGTVNSDPTTSRVSSSSTSITAIGATSGTAMVGETLTAGALTPSGATATYQWQRCSTSGGTYASISGATSSTYALTASDYNYYIQVTATGSGSYSGTVTSAYAGPVAAGTITAISAISGTTLVGSTLTAGALTPSGATATYQWQRCSSSDGVYTSISGATSSTYTLVTSDEGMYIEVVATGSGSYSGTVTSAYAGPVTSGSATAITAIGAISGTTTVGQTLTAGALTPSGATATYQWQRCSSSDGVYTSISGATSSTYTLTASDYGYYIQVTATGSGSYSGTVTSAYTGPAAACIITAISAITGTTTVGSTLTAGTVTPSDATVTYQWQYSDTGSGTTYTNIPGATASTYYISDYTYSYCYIRVVVTGTGAYTGTVNSDPTTKRVGQS